MLNILSLPLTKTTLRLIVFVNCLYGLGETALGATFRLFPDTFINNNLSIETVTSQDLIASDLLGQLMPSQEGKNTKEYVSGYEEITQAVSGGSSLSFESLISSLTQIKLDATREEIPVKEVPILEQVPASDIYKEIYDFATTAAEELSDPVSVGVLPDLDPLSLPTPRGGVRTVGTRATGVAVPGVNGSSLPRFGGPVQIIGSPSANFVTPLRQVNLPSAQRVQARSWGDREVDVFFASLPEADIVNIDEFMRTIYRTNPSDLVKEIDKNLDLTIDADFQSMPKEIFPANPMPSDYLNRTL